MPSPVDRRRSNRVSPRVWRRPAVLERRGRFDSIRKDHRWRLPRGRSGWATRRHAGVRSQPREAAATARLNVLREPDVDALWARCHAASPARLVSATRGARRTDARGDLSRISPHAIGRPNDRHGIAAEDSLHGYFDHRLPVGTAYRGDETEE